MFQAALRVTSVTLAVLILYGCAASRVAIVYPKPSAGLNPAGSITNVYMIVKRPEAERPETLSKTGKLNRSEFPIEINIDQYASRLATLFDQRGGRLTAYYVQSRRPENYIEQMKPSNILYVNFEDLKLRGYEHMPTPNGYVYTPGKRGSKERAKAPKVQRGIQGKMTVTMRLVRYPDMVPVASAAKTFVISTSLSELQSFSSQYRDEVSKLMRSAADWTASSLVRVDVMSHYRKLYAVKGDTQSTQALKAVGASRWPEAVSIWKGRLDANPASWRDAWNLGIWAERNRETSIAKLFYQKAQSGCANDPDAPTAADWAAINQDLAQSPQVSAGTYESVNAWFGQRIAVLPFTDYSTSFDGPIYVRRLTQESLARHGYNAMSLDEVDNILRDNGFTQGGQLKATTPEQLAQWLKADLLLFGDLQKFDEFTLGIFGWKRIHGTYRIWRTSDKRDFWVNEKSVSRVVAGQSGFGEQLIGSWFDKARHKPMALESADFVDDQLVELPRRPY